jgi:hypothetical protein
LFYRSGWTQEELAKKEGKSPQWVAQRIRFGRFLNFSTAVEIGFGLVSLALKNVLDERQWVGRLDKDGKPFASFEAFATHRLWQDDRATISTQHTRQFL